MGAIHFGPRQQVIDGATVVVDLDAEQRQADRPERTAEQGAVVAAQGNLRVPLPGTEGIDDEDEEAELHQAQAAGLHHRIAPRTAPVTVNDENSRHFAFDVGNVSRGSHPNVGERLQQ